jgi:hypothetical protein
MGPRMARILTRRTKVSLRYWPTTSTRRFVVVSGQRSWSCQAMRGLAICFCCSVVLAIDASDISGPSMPLRVLPCSSWSGDNSSDGWALVDQEDGTYVIRNTQHQKTFCLDAMPATNGSAVPMASPCDGRPQQRWRKNSTTLANAVILQSISDPLGRCLVVSSSAYTLGPGVLLSECNPVGAGDWFLGKNVKWFVPNASQSAIKSHGGGCCGDIFTTRPACLAVDHTPTCMDLRNAKWCNTTLDALTRAKELVAQMTLQEKATNMVSPCTRVLRKTQ